MKELISKESAIKTVFNMCCRWDTEDPNDLKLMLLSAFQELPPVRQWIPCSERLPELDTEVLLSDNTELLFIGMLEKYSMKWLYEDCILHDLDEIKAWMPLPEPYEVKR